MIILPFTTPVTNVLRFIVIEYLILKLCNYAIESLVHTTAHHRTKSGKKLEFREGWPSFFLVPYRLRERSIRIAIPLLFVISINVLLIAVEFGFASSSIRPSAVTTFAEIGTENFAASAAPIDVMPALWMERVQFLHERCVNRRNFLVSAAEGFVLRRSIYGGGRLYEDKIICGWDSNLDRKLNQILFNISHAGQLDTVDQFQYSFANLTIRNISPNRFRFQGGGDIDFDVDGTLDLSSEGFNRREFSYTVSGSCTAFENSDENSSDDSIVYCFLTDNDSFRFIFPGTVSENSPVKMPTMASEGQVLRLQDASGLFRAKIFDYLGEDSVPRDGDHLAAIKTLAVVLRTRQSVLDEAAVPLLLPAISRTFCIATLFGATSLRNVTIGLVEGPWTERASVEGWALAMMLSLIFGAGLASMGLALAGRRGKVWNIPNTFNSLAKLAVGVVIGPDGDTVLRCGLRYDRGQSCYGIMDETEEAVNVGSLEKM